MQSAKIFAWDSINSQGSDVVRRLIGVFTGCICSKAATQRYTPFEMSILYHSSEWFTESGKFDLYNHKTDNKVCFDEE